MKMPVKQTPTPAPKLLDQVRGKIRLKHYSIRTEQAYTDWIKRFILFHDKRHPKQTQQTRSSVTENISHRFFREATRQTATKEVHQNHVPDFNALFPYSMRDYGS